MKFTQQQLLEAARAAGLGRESFTTAELREQLGVSTKDRQKLNQFYRSFRTFQASVESEIEKLGPNCYRLRVQAEERTVEVHPFGLSEISEIAELAAPPAPVAIETEPVAVEALEMELPRAPAVAPSWRAHVQRLGSRMRSWFGGGAGAAAQA